jgi:hypothetical protein
MEGTATLTMVVPSGSDAPSFPELSVAKPHTSWPRHLSHREIERHLPASSPVEALIADPQTLRGTHGCCE